MGNRVMVCDDAVFMRMLLKDLLIKNGYDVVGEAENGQVAVEKYEKLKPDLIIMDVVMPVCDGVEAIKMIMEKDHNARIIVCSALGQKKMVVTCMKAGAKDFIVKPFQGEKFIQAVDRIMGKSA